MVSKCFIAYHVNYSQTHACTLSSSSQSILLWCYGDVVLLSTTLCGKYGVQKSASSTENVYYLVVCVHYVIQSLIR